MGRALHELRQRGEHLIDDGPVAHQHLVQQVFAPESRALREDTQQTVRSQ